MTKLSPARRAALSQVGECRRRSARIRDLLRNSNAMAALSEQDRALATRLAVGAVAARGYLDLQINAQLKGSKKLEPKVRDALHIAAFELLYLSTPTEVAVSQGVELVRSAQPRAAALANAVLRKLSTSKPNGIEYPCLPERSEGSCIGAAGLNAHDSTNPTSPTVSDLARLGGLPDWLCERALDSLGPELAFAWAATALEPPAPTVAANHALVNAEEAFELLKVANCEPKPTSLDGAFVLQRPSRLNGSGLVESTRIIPCDLAAYEVALKASPKPKERVLEVGQGRGTKSLLLQSHAISHGGPCNMTAVELSESKSRGAERRIACAGLSKHVRCLAFDGRELPGRDDLGDFDLVFVDAPCTGTGTLRRHPEIAWSLSPKDPEMLSSLQLELLKAAASRVAANGRLLYATCSVLKEENEDVVEGFLTSPAGRAFKLAGSSLVGGQDSDLHFFALMNRGA